GRRPDCGRRARLEPSARHHGLRGGGRGRTLFVWREARAPQPMLPLSLFGHRLFALTALVGLLFNIAFYGLIFVLSLYFQKVSGWSPLATGLAFVPMMGAVLPVNLIAPRLAERFGAPAVIAVGSAVAAMGCLA